MKIVLMVGLVLLIVVIVLALEIYLAVRGPRETFANPDRQPQNFGSGPTPLKYVVLGDSTAAGQGADKDHGIAPVTARQLAADRSVQLTNVALSGAKVEDVLNDQLASAESLKPDLVLLSVGANDVTGLTSLDKVAADFETISTRLVASNCQVKIIVTGSPDVGGAHRFAQPLRWLAGIRTGQLNRRLQPLVDQYQLTFAPIAERTGPAFRRDRGLLAADRFHPNNDGYALWTEVLDTSLADALRNQPSHCAERPAS